METTTLNEVPVNITTPVQDNKVAVVSDTQQNDADIADLVILQDNQALTTSLKIAEVFEKQHKNVIQAIENGIESLKEINGLKFQPVEKGFIPASYTDSKGERRSMYYLNRDAFSFVVMGFTGKKAVDWKWKYIQAFNKMEEQLRDRPKLMSTVDMFGLAYQALKEHEERLNLHDQQISEIKDRTAAIQAEQTQRLDTQETRLAAIEEKVEDRVFPYPDRKKARQLSNRMYRICEARQKHDEENHPDQVYDIPRYIEHLKEEVIEQLNQATGRNIAREVQQAQTYYMRKYYEAKARDKSPSSDILRPAAIRNLTQISYISSDPDLYTQLELLLENYDYGGMDREE